MAAVAPPWPPWPRCMPRCIQSIPASMRAGRPSAHPGGPRIRAGAMYGSPPPPGAHRASCSATSTYLPRREQPWPRHVPSCGGAEAGEEVEVRMERSSRGPSRRHSPDTPGPASRPARCWSAPLWWAAPGTGDCLSLAMHGGWEDLHPSFEWWSWGSCTPSARRIVPSPPVEAQATSHESVGVSGQVSAGMSPVTAPPGLRSSATRCGSRSPDRRGWWHPGGGGR